MDTIDVTQELNSRKRQAEGMILLSVYKNPDLYFELDILTDQDFNSAWKPHYNIIEAVIKSGRNIINDIEIETVLKDNIVLKQQYDALGGYEKIREGMTVVREENFEAYVKSLIRINCLTELCKHGFLPEKKYLEYQTKTLEEIQADFEGIMTEIFMKASTNDTIEDLKDGLMDVVMEAHQGMNRGLPFVSPMLTKHTNGMNMGSLAIFGANSGVGKTTFTLCQLLPSIWDHGEQVLIVANEEESRKWKQDIITWVINNKHEANFERQRWNEGRFTSDEMELLSKGVEWLNSKIEDKTIHFINMSNFHMGKTLKLIKTYILRHDVKYFIIDTLKPDHDMSGNSAEISFKLLQSMTALYDLIKPSSLNAFVWCTYQIAPGSANKKFLNNSDFGLSKQIVNVAGMTMLGRKAMQSEKENGKNPIKVKNLENFIIELKEDKEYLFGFFGKNRKGPVHNQLVYELDQGLLIMNEVGTTRIEEGE